MSGTRGRVVEDVAVEDVAVEGVAVEGVAVARSVSSMPWTQLAEITSLFEIGPPGTRCRGMTNASYDNGGGDKASREIGGELGPEDKSSMGIGHLVQGEQAWLHAVAQRCNSQCGNMKANPAGGATMWRIPGRRAVPILLDALVLDQHHAQNETLNAKWESSELLSEQPA